MINLYYWAYGQYWYSHSVMASHSRTENRYFPSLDALAKWEYCNID